MDKGIMVRDISPDETVLVRELHARMGIDYQFPEISGPLFAIRKMVVDEDGDVQAAAAMKLIGEAYLWVNPDNGDYAKATDILRLAQICHERAKGLQIEDISAWIPPHVEPVFGNMLSRMGWSRSPWASWSVRI